MLLLLLDVSHVRVILFQPSGIQVIQVDGANDSDSEDDDDDDEDEDDDEKDKAKDNGLDEEGEVEVSVFLRTPFSLLKVVSNNICLGLKDCDQLP